MTSTIHHPVAVPSRGLIICEMEEESNEPKTILEIGGVSRPHLGRPSYIIPAPARPQPLPPSINNPPFHWKAQPEIVPSPYPAYTEFQEQKIVRLANANWSGALEKLQASQAAANQKGIISISIFIVEFFFHHWYYWNINFSFRPFYAEIIE